MINKVYVVYHKFTPWLLRSKSYNDWWDGHMDQIVDWIENHRILLHVIKKKKKSVKSPIMYNMEKSGIPNLTWKQNQHQLVEKAKAP